MLWASRDSLPASDTNTRAAATLRLASRLNRCYWFEWLIRGRQKLQWPMERGGI
jgi:hypothetical protein